MYFKTIIKGPIYLISAIVLGIVVIPVGLIYTLGKKIVEFKFSSFFGQIGMLLIHILFVFSWLCERIAVGLDILANVASGELIEDCITSKEDTLFGEPGITLSASTGQIEYLEKLNPTGKWFTNILSSVFEENHSLHAYLDVILKHATSDVVAKMDREQLIGSIKTILQGSK